MACASLASLERGLRALVASARCLASLERRQFAARVPGACRARARILPRERALRAREAGLHPSHEFALPSSRVGEACLTRKWAASRARVGFLAARAWAASRASVGLLAARALVTRAILGSLGRQRAQPCRSSVASLAAPELAALPRESGQPRAPACASSRKIVGCLAARELAACARWCRACCAGDGAARWGARCALGRSLRAMVPRAISLTSRDGAACWCACCARWCRALGRLLRAMGPRDGAARWRDCCARWGRAQSG